MLNVFVGSDYKRIQEARNKVLGTSNFRRFESDTIVWGEIETLLTTTDLFGGKEALLLEEMYDDHKSECENHIETMIASPMMVVWTERDPAAAFLKLCAKYKIPITKLDVKIEKKETSVFTVASAYGEGNKKLLWMRFHEALRAGHRAEEIAGTLWWQMKTMWLAAGKKGKADMLREHATACLSMYEKARKGEGLLEALLEEWILGLTFKA